MSKTEQIFHLEGHSKAQASILRCKVAVQVLQHLLDRAGSCSELRYSRECRSWQLSTPDRLCLPKQRLCWGSHLWKAFWDQLSH